MDQTCILKTSSLHYTPTPNENEAKQCTFLSLNEVRISQRNIHLIIWHNFEVVCFNLDKPCSRLFPVTSANNKYNNSLYSNQKCYCLWDPELQIYLLGMFSTSHPFDNALIIWHNFQVVCFNLDRPCSRSVRFKEEKCLVTTANNKDNTSLYQNQKCY